MNALTRSFLRLSLPVHRRALRRRLGRVVMEEVDGVPLVILPEVFNPVVFRTGAFLARTLAARSTPDAQRPTPNALDLGTGSGIGAVFAARCDYRVVGVDINPEAVRCAEINARLNRLEDRIEIREGDLFAPVQGERFGLVLFNPPFFRGTPRSALDRAWRADDVLERFAAGLCDVLTEEGRALVVFSSHGDTAGLLGALRACDFAIDTAAQRDFGTEVMTVYEVRR